MMGPRTLSAKQLEQLARDITLFLSEYKHITDSYIIEFFTEGLWETLPLAWQEALNGLSAPQIADLLLDSSLTERCYPSAWPLSLLAFRASAHALSFPRMPDGQAEQGTRTLWEAEFQRNQSQSSLLGHIFRKHVKPKKQHEIRRLGTLVKQLCDLTECKSVVDVGSGQGHLTRFLSFGLGLSVTGIEADPALVSMASKFDGQLLSTLQKESQRKNGTAHHCMTATGPSPRHTTGWVNPKASWEDFVKQLEMGECESSGQAATVWPSKKREWKSNPVLDLDYGFSPAQSLSPSCADHDVSPNTMGDDESKPTAFHKPRGTMHTDSVSSPKRQCAAERGAGSPLGKPFSSSCTERDSSEGTGDGGFILTGLHACGDLSATLLRHFSSCPHVLGITSVACCYMKITTLEHPFPPGVLAPVCPAHTEKSSHLEFGYPMSSWLRGLPGHQLSYKAREGACHAMEDYLQRLREESGLLRTHCYRAVLETVIRAAQPDLRRAGIQTIKKAHLLPFSEYARLGLPRVGLSPDLPLNHSRLDTLLVQQERVLVYFSLALLLAPVVETLVLLDRMLFLQEKGLESQLVPLFDPVFSPRNLVLVAVKPRPEGKTQSSTA